MISVDGRDYIIQDTYEAETHSCRCVEQFNLTGWFINYSNAQLPM